MRKTLFILAVSACMALGFGQLALAADGAAVFKRSCAGCHGQNAERGTGGTQPIKGRSAADIQKMLRGYADGSYGGKQKATMQNVAKKLSADDLKAVAEHVGGLK